MSREFPYSITPQGAVILWPGDLEHVAFGRLDLLEAAQVEAMVAEGRQQRRRHLDAEETRAKVADLDAYRQQRDEHPDRPERGAR